MTVFTLTASAASSIPLSRIYLPLLIFLLHFSSARSRLGAYYTKNPESISAPIGDDVIFTCQANIAGDPMEWRFRPIGGRWQDVPHGNVAPAEMTMGSGGVMPPPASAQWVNNKHTLSELTVHLHNESLAGEYRCISWYGASALMSLAAKLRVAKLESVPVLPDGKIHIAPGGTALIRCPTPTSEPPATIVYYKLTEGKQVPVSLSSDSVQGTGGALLVKPKGYSMYSCAAVNEMSQETKQYAHKIIVDVQDGPMQKPRFTDDMPTEVQGVVGSSINIACGALGRPAPKIAWRQAGPPSLEPIRNKSPILNITELKPNDEGYYICEATNAAGQAERTVKLSVWSPPIIHTPLEDHSSRADKERRDGAEWAREGSHVKLPCGMVTGRPAPVIEWIINGKEVDSVPNAVVTANYELEINPVEKFHAGIVQCFATNSLNSATAFKVLYVIPKEQMTVDEEEPSDMERGRPGNNRRHPRPRPHKNVLIPPSQPNVTRLSDNSVMVRWSVPNNTGLPIRFFKVQHRDLNQNGPDAERGSKWKTSNQDVSAHVRSYEVDGLEPDHYYKFRISAVYSNNDNKQGKNSGRFFLQRGMGLARAPPAPYLVRAEAVSTTEIKLHWQLPTPAPNVKETPVEGFYVYYRPVSSADEYVKAAVEGGRARALIIKHLMPGSTYEIKLQSFTPATASNFSSIVQEKTLKSPEAETPEEDELLKGITPVKGMDGDDVGGIQLYHIVGAGVGGIAVLSVLVLAALIFYKKRKGGGRSIPDKQPEGGLGDDNLPNGYLSPPTVNNSSGLAVKNSTITITPNPLHTEGENVDLEMSYISAQNNNCSSQSPRVSAEMNMIPSTCREELRMQNHNASIPTRENYV